MKVTRPVLFAGLLASFVFGVAAPVVHAQEKNKVCPIMTEDEIDEEEVVEFEGQKVYLCCTKCSKIWKKNPKYFLKASLDRLPQFKGKEASLGLDKVELLEQRFCPIRKTSIVSPDSPSTEYKGVKVYFFDERALDRWKKDPDAAAKAAIEAGLLPQLKGK